MNVLLLLLLLLLFSIIEHPFVFIFCVTLLFQFAPVEAVITAITDSFPKLQRRRILVTAIVCVIMGLMGIPFICQVGIIYKV